MLPPHAIIREIQRTTGFVPADFDGLEIASGKDLFRLCEFREEHGFVGWHGINFENSELTAFDTYRFERFEREDEIFWAHQQGQILLVFPLEEFCLNLFDERQEVAFVSSPRKKCNEKFFEKLFGKLAKFSDEEYANLIRELVRFSAGYEGDGR